jgi:CspA family cold shock protein
VKWFNESKGYGFIVNDDGGPDLFVHHRQIQGDGFKTLAEGQRVTYDVIDGPKGLSANNVRPA